MLLSLQNNAFTKIDSAFSCRIEREAIKHHHLSKFFAIPFSLYTVGIKTVSPFIFLCCSINTLWQLYRENRWETKSSEFKIIRNAACFSIIKNIGHLPFLPLYALICGIKVLAETLFNPLSSVRKNSLLRGLIMNEIDLWIKKLQQESKKENQISYESQKILIEKYINNLTIQEMESLYTESADNFYDALLEKVQKQKKKCCSLKIKNSDESTLHEVFNEYLKSTSKSYAYRVFLTKNRQNIFKKIQSSSQDHFAKKYVFDFLCSLEKAFAASGSIALLLEEESFYILCEIIEEKVDDHNKKAAQNIFIQYLFQTQNNSSRVREIRKNIPIILESVSKSIESGVQFHSPVNAIEFFHFKTIKTFDEQQDEIFRCMEQKAAKIAQPIDFSILYEIEKRGKILLSEDELANLNVAVNKNIEKHLDIYFLSTESFKSYLSFFNESKEKIKEILSEIAQIEEKLEIKEAPLSQIFLKEIYENAYKNKTIQLEEFVQEIQAVVLILNEVAVHKLEKRAFYQVEDISQEQFVLDPQSKTESDSYLKEVLKTLIILYQKKEEENETLLYTLIIDKMWSKLNNGTLHREELEKTTTNGLIWLVDQYEAERNKSCPKEIDVTAIFRKVCKYVRKDIQQKQCSSRFQITEPLEFHLQVNTLFMLLKRFRDKGDQKLIASYFCRNKEKINEKECYITYFKKNILIPVLREKYIKNPATIDFASRYVHHFSFLYTSSLCSLDAIWNEMVFIAEKIAIQNGISYIYKKLSRYNKENKLPSICLDLMMSYFSLVITNSEENIEQFLQVREEYFTKKYLGLDSSKKEFNKIIFIEKNLPSFSKKYVDLFNAVEEIENDQKLSTHQFNEAKRNALLTSIVGKEVFFRSYNIKDLFYLEIEKSLMKKTSFMNEMGSSFFLYDFILRKRNDQDIDSKEYIKKTVEDAEEFFQSVKNILSKILEEKKYSKDQIKNSIAHFSYILIPIALNKENFLFINEKEIIVDESIIKKLISVLIDIAIKEESSFYTAIDSKKFHDKISIEIDQVLIHAQ